MIADPNYNEVQDGHRPWHERHKTRVWFFTIGVTIIIGGFVALGLSLTHPPGSSGDEAPSMPVQFRASFYGGYNEFNCGFKGYIYYNAELRLYRTDWAFESDEVSDCGRVGSYNETYFARTDIVDGGNATDPAGVPTPVQRSYHVVTNTHNTSLPGAYFSCHRSELRDTTFWAPNYLSAATKTGAVTFVGTNVDADVYVSNNLFGGNGTVTTYVSRADGSWLQMDINGGAGTDWNGQTKQKYSIAFGTGGLVAQPVPAAIFDPMPYVSCGDN